MYKPLHYIEGIPAVISIEDKDEIIAILRYNNDLDRVTNACQERNTGIVIISLGRIKFNVHGNDLAALAVFVCVPSNEDKSQQLLSMTLFCTKYYTQQDVNEQVKKAANFACGVSGMRMDEVIMEKDGTTLPMHKPEFN